MGKIRRGNYVFMTWIGDHDHHVHVYKERRQVLKWDLDGNKVLKGQSTERLRKIIKRLKKENRL